MPFFTEPMSCRRQGPAVCAGARPSSGTPEARPRVPRCRRSVLALRARGGAMCAALDGVAVRREGEGAAPVPVEPKARRIVTATGRRGRA